MWYKEWTTTRFKFYLWLGILALLGLMQLTVWSPFNFYYAEFSRTGQYPDLFWYTPLFKNWLGVSATATFFCALLGGADLVSEEVDKGTLSFLLTRPISRKQIYTIKILTNLAAFAVAFSVVTLPILLYDQFQPRPTDLWEGLGYAGLILLGGAGIICLSGLVSVFTRNVLQTLAITVGILIGLFALWSTLLVQILAGSLTELLGWLFVRYDPVTKGSYLAMPAESIIALFVTVFLILVTVILLSLFWAGMLFFSRKEF
jgi:ABC-type transport system involved in multi-copper enzyme maturation permease subunit